MDLPPKLLKHFDTALLPSLRERLHDEVAFVAAHRTHSSPNDIVSGSLAIATVEDLEQALSNLLGEPRRSKPQSSMNPPSPVATTNEVQAVISVALSENRAVEWVGYAMAVILFGVGIFLLCAGIFINNEPGVKISSIAGGISANLFFMIPLRMAVRSRRDNIRTRLFGTVLARVSDPNAIKKLLHEMFKDMSRDAGDFSGMGPDK
ncbi:MAG: hypothetical protein HY289_16855 [Planctomycetes bacterium]|nr:hypothetical protein [Planctomycetota bacterium]